MKSILVIMSVMIGVCHAMEERESSSITKTQMQDQCRETPDRNPLGFMVPIKDSEASSLSRYEWTFCRCLRDHAWLLDRIDVTKPIFPIKSKDQTDDVIDLYDAAGNRWSVFDNSDLRYVLGDNNFLKLTK